MRVLVNVTKKYVLTGKECTVGVHVLEITQTKQKSFSLKSNFVVNCSSTPTSHPKRLRTPRTNSLQHNVNKNTLSLKGDNIISHELEPQKEQDKNTPRRTEGVRLQLTNVSLSFPYNSY